MTATETRRRKRARTRVRVPLSQVPPVWPVKGSITDLAASIGYSVSWVSRVLRGDLTPGLDGAEALAKAMGLNLTQFSKILRRVQAETAA